MSQRSAFNRDVALLTHEFWNQNPPDHLQFCADFFLKRLETERAEARARASASPSQDTAPEPKMASMFANPFGGSDKAMQSIGEEEESHHTTGASSGGFGTTSFNPDNAGGSGAASNYHFGRRTSVSAESINPAEADNENWAPPVFPKSDEQKGRLRHAISPNFLFSNLEEAQLNQLLNALQEKPIPAKGIKVINQGESGDYFYVVEKGKFDVHINKSGHLQPGADGMGEKVASIEPGGSFGELALMYNTPRAATVVSVEPSTIWSLDRVTFRRVLMTSAYKRRQLYESFLAEVPLLEGLTDYERSKIADALHTEKYTSGHTIIKEGDPGENFFFLESGEAEVFKQGHEKPVHHYKKGDYFGELALLKNEPRAASVISRTDVKLATLGKEGFQRLLGPVEEVMRRNDPSRRDDSVDPLTKTA